MFRGRASGAPVAQRPPFPRENSAHDQSNSPANFGAAMRDRQPTVMKKWQLPRFLNLLVVAFRGALLSCRDAFRSRQGVQRSIDVF